MIKRIFVVTIIGLLTACASNISTPIYPDITFQSSPKLSLTLASFDSKIEYSQPLIAPNVEHEFPVDLGRTVARWVKDRLVPIGDSGKATLTVIDASVIETPIEKESGVTGLVTNEQSHRYKATITARLEAFDPVTERTRHTTATVSRSTTTAEDISIHEREAIWYALSEKLMADLDKTLTTAVIRHMSIFIP